MSLSIIIVLLFLHFIGDWILQPREIANQKSEFLGVCIFHSIIASAALWLGCIMFIYYKHGIYHDVHEWRRIIINILGVFIIYMVIHLIQDWYLWRAYKKFRNKDFHYFEDYWFYTTIAIDQFLHLSSIFILVKLLLFRK